jgi:membrane protein implicated in regulation of membrane protease activity
LDGDVGADLGDGASSADHHLGDGFKIISVHGLAAFFMMFGLVGFAMNRENHAPVIVSIISGVIAGAASVWIITKLFQMANKLQSVGNLDISKAVGCRGIVYMRIPKGASGRVMLNIGGRQREMDAVHVSGEEVATGTPIAVVRIDESLAVVDLA